MSAPVSGDGTKDPKEASAAVSAAQQAVLEALPFGDTADFDDAARGFLGTIDQAKVTTAQGRTVWSLAPYYFLDAEQAPPTVNPSLWRQAKLNMHHGLFEVVPGVYQVRGLDIANMTLIEGDTGVIVVDTLTSIEGAQAALELYYQHRGVRPVTAVMFTHTHTDHWGGARGVVDDDAMASGRVPLIAPNLFIEHAVSENIIAGPAMLRRAQYQFGPLLAKGPKGHVDCGLGKTMAAGAVALLRPTDLIMATGDTRVIDGLTFEFQMAPNSEAPAEMHFFVPRYRLLNLAENCTHNFHNLLPFRGADVRDALAWSKYLGEALQLWGGKAEVMCGQHHWPIWGASRVDGMIREQRDLYKFAHDQTVRLMNHGLTASEIAEQIRLPRSLEGAWHARGYYGHIRHNVKAIYQKYLGWYDANPVNLDPLPPVEAGRKYVSYMGGAEALLARARADFANGEYRFVAQVVGHLVFAEPDNAEARAAGRHAGAARLCRRECDLAQCLSVRRAGAAPGYAGGSGSARPAARDAGGAAHRAAMGRARGQAERAQGGGQAYRAELDVHRHRRALRAHLAELCADLCGRRAGVDRRCGVHAGAFDARCGHCQGHELSGSGRRREDQLRGQSDAAGRADVADGRVPAHVRDRRAEAGCRHLR